MCVCAHARFALINTRHRQDESEVRGTCHASDFFYKLCSVCWVGVCAHDVCCLFSVRATRRNDNIILLCLFIFALNLSAESLSLDLALFVCCKAQCEEKHSVRPTSCMRPARDIFPGRRDAITLLSARLLDSLVRLLSGRARINCVRG